MTDRDRQLRNYSLELRLAAAEMLDCIKAAAEKGKATTQQMIAIAPLEHHYAQLQYWTHAVQTIRWCQSLLAPQPKEPSHGKQEGQTGDRPEEQDRDPGPAGRECCVQRSIRGQAAGAGRTAVELELRQTPVQIRSEREGEVD